MDNEFLANALSKAKQAADRNQAQVLQSSDLKPAELTALVSNGWLQEIIRAWYMLVRPDVASGDSAAWYANFWDFIRVYAKHRFDDDYCLAAEPSLDVHTDNPTLAQQIIIITKQGAGLRKLPYNTSLLIYADTNSFPEPEIKTQKHGINIMSLSYALCKVGPAYFKNNPREIEIALRMIQNPGELSQVLAHYRLQTAAERLAGAYQFLGKTNFADTIIEDLKLFGMRIKPSNPFASAKPLIKTSSFKSPYANRIQAMWTEGRETVAKVFPKPPGIPKDAKGYLTRLDSLYQYDAYHSLSIEGYRVTPELINKVKNQEWDPKTNLADNQIKNALAAKGYFDAFQLVRQGIADILAGANAAKLVQNQLQNWYRQLFGSSVAAGIIPAEALFGYRNERVFIRNSRHSPPPQAALMDAMEAFFNCLQHEEHPGVNAILGHYFFVFIHPFMDGNGRIARFLMNTLLAAGGYPWTVVRVDNRQSYIDILENTHLHFDLTDFAEFIAQEMAVKWQ